LKAFTPRCGASPHPSSSARLRSTLAAIASAGSLACSASAIAQSARTPPSAEATATADTPFNDLPTVEVTAARTGVVAEDSTRAISVVDAQRLRDAVGTAGIQSLLAETPGIQFARTGGLGGQIVMRGFNSNITRSVLTVDGDRYRGRNTLEFNMFDPAAIERIEVIRGAASGLYGADAMNGVVNVVTRRARVDPNQAFTLKPTLRSFEMNSVNDMVGGRAELIGGGNGFDVLVGAHAREAGDYRTPLGRALNSGFESRGMDFVVGYRPDADSRVELSARYQRVSTERAGGLGAAPGMPWQEVREDPIEEKYLRLAYERRNLGALADKLDAALYVRKFDTHIHQTNRTNAAVTVDTHLRVDTPTVFGGHAIGLKAIDRHVLTYGVDFFREQFYGRVADTRRLSPATGAILASTPPTRMDRGSTTTNAGVFVNDEWTLNDRWSLAGTLRYDWLRTDIDKTPLANESALLQQTFARVGNVTNSAVTGNLGAIHRLTPDWQLVANIGRGFRAPSGQDRTLTGAAGTIVTLASPDLEPEKSTTIEAGARWSGPSHRLSVTAYRTRYTNLITLAMIDPTLYQRRNVGRAEMQGLEVEGHWQFARQWRVRHALTGTRGTDRTTGTPLVEIAPWVALVGLRYDAPQGWYGESVVRAYKGKTRIDPAQERATASYAIVDVYAGFDLARWIGSDWKGWRAVAGIENLFDRAGRNPTVAQSMAYPAGLVGNPLVEPGRAFVLKLSSNY